MTVHNADPRQILADDNAYGFIDKTAVSQRIFNPYLYANKSEHTMLRAMLDELRRAQSFKFSVAFITSSALGLLKQALLDFKGEGTIYTSTYLDFNEPSVFEELLKFPNINVRVLNDSVDAFHSKGYIFHQARTTTAIVGSSNLTRGALLMNEEWNLRFSAMPDGHITEQLEDAIDRLHAASSPLTTDWIRAYESRRKPQIVRAAFEAPTEPVVPVGRIEPNLMQQEALNELAALRNTGAERALIISATGTGKTILAALAVRQAKPRRVLFLVHREQILNKTIEEFQKVLEEPADEFGKFVGSQREIDRKYVFATVQTMSREENLQSISAQHFDYVIIDEVHRAGATSYTRIIDYLKPDFLLGLTATPERTDGTNIYELFHYNVPYEIRLQKALESKMLVPFSYYGVSDYTDTQGTTIEETSDLRKLVVDERVDYIVQMLETYGHARNVKGLMFCGRKDEAKELSREFNKRSLNGRALRTAILSGEDSQIAREDTVQRLQRGELDYILTVDIFNEGIDIPDVNQVVMLRNTQSSIIFTQQLGRGLRKFTGKDHLRVIDFIGNYKNNFLIPIALFGDRSLNKDSIREKLIQARQSGAIAGISNISFDEVSRERVLDALSAAKLDSMVMLKKTYRELEERLGRTPMRYDFAHYDTANPTVFLTTNNTRPTYWHFLKKIDNATPELSPVQQGYLALLDREFLNGKRPHELLLLKELLAHGNIAAPELKEIYAEYGAVVEPQTIESVARFLNLEFFTDAGRERYGNRPIASFAGQRFEISQEFKAEYEGNIYFAQHIDDVLEAGLYLNQHHYSPAGKLLAGERYSRKDVCRLLNWQANHESTMYGYKADQSTSTCPIFITYHKSDDIDDAIKYEDHLEDESTLFWYTKHGRNLKSRVESGIINGNYQLDIFVKKDDAEGTDFVYLGQAKTPRDAQQTTIDSKPIVSMRLDLVHPLQTGLYDYFTASSLEQTAPERATSVQ